MAAAKIVLEPVFEADFDPVSFGFRPKRSAQQALEAVRVGGNRGRVWVLDADIKACLDASSHCSFADCRALEQAVLGGWQLDT
jgi:RNA-directed DNA polymerase